MPFAGLWLPDRETLASAAIYGGRTRQVFMRERAIQACDAYSQWCNGEVYLYRVERMTDCLACGVEQAELIEACSGVFGRSECLDLARTIVTSHAMLAVSAAE